MTLGLTLHPPCEGAVTAVQRTSSQQRRPAARQRLHRWKVVGLGPGRCAFLQASPACTLGENVHDQQGRETFRTRVKHGPLNPWKSVGLASTDRLLRMTLCLAVLGLLSHNRCAAWKGLPAIHVLGDRGARSLASAFRLSCLSLHKHLPPHCHTVKVPSQMHTKHIEFGEGSVWASSAW